jgi:hypothetical protein
LERVSARYLQARAQIAAASCFTSHPHRAGSLHSKAAVKLCAGRETELHQKSKAGGRSRQRHTDSFTWCGRTHSIRPPEFSFDRFSKRDDRHYCCLHSQLRKKPFSATLPINSLSTALCRRSLRLYAAQSRRWIAGQQGKIGTCHAKVGVVLYVVDGVAKSTSGGFLCFVFNRYGLVQNWDPVAVTVHSDMRGTRQGSGRDTGRTREKSPEVNRSGAANCLR